MVLKCAECLKAIPGREFLTCAFCKNKYDLNCAQVSVQRFINTLTPEHRKQWKCRTCYGATPTTAELKHRHETSNITTRAKKYKKSKPLNKSASSIDSNIFGDTLQNTSVTPQRTRKII